MKNSLKKSIASLVYAASLSTLAHPVFCAETVESAQAKLKAMESTKDKHLIGYTHALFILAEAYYLDGNDALAQETFRKCLPLYFESCPTYREGAYASALMNWAGILLKGNGKEIDMSQVDSLTLEALEKIDTVTDKLARAQSYQGAIFLFRKTGNVKEEQRCMKFLLDCCSECEADKNASLTQIRRAAIILEWVARTMLPNNPGPLTSKPLSNQDGDKLELTSDQREATEALIIRAIRLCERKSELNRENASLHRFLARLYAQQGKVELSNEHEKLAKKLTPAADRRARTSCGRVVGKVTDVGIVTIGCGMG